MQGGGQQRNKSLAPINIKHLDEMKPEPTGEGYTLDDREVFCVRFVARLDDIEDVNNATKIAIADSTGKIVCVDGNRAVLTECQKRGDALCVLTGSNARDVGAGTCIAKFQSLVTCMGSVSLDRQEQHLCYFTAAALTTILILTTWGGRTPEAA